MHVAMAMAAHHREAKNKAASLGSIYIQYFGTYTLHGVVVFPFFFWDFSHVSLKVFVGKTLSPFFPPPPPHPLVRVEILLFAIGVFSHVDPRGQRHLKYSCRKRGGDLEA